jgi:hypothetical protein
VLVVLTLQLSPAACVAACVESKQAAIFTAAAAATASAEMMLLQCQSQDAGVTRTESAVCSSCTCGDCCHL